MDCLKRGDTAKGCALCVCGAVPYIRRKGKAKSCKEEEKSLKKVNESTGQRVNELGLMGVGVFCFRTRQTLRTLQTLLLSDLSDFNLLTR